MESNFPIIYPVNPYHIHTRLAVQQGVFLCPGDVKIPLFKIISDLAGSNKPTAIIKLIWSPANLRERLDALDELRRMNISRASLFPGLDGFAESLKYRLRHYYNLSQRRR